jgi:hypothetical protein
MKIITSKLNDKYYLIYKYLFNYSHNKFKLINNIILLNFLRENNNYICGNHFLYSFTKQVYNSIILKQNHKASYINLHNYINDKIYKNNNKCLIITNFISIVKNSYINNTNHKKIDTLFFYDINLTENKLLLNYPVVLTSKDKNFKINGTLYSSFNKKIYLQFLNNLKNNNEDNNILIPHIKYDIISCHYGYIYGLGLTSSYNMTLQIVNIISTIGMALKHIAKDGTLLLFWSIVNVNVPVIKKILSILSYGFKNVEIIDNDINQNLFIGVPEYYIKCSGYKDNINYDLINKLLDIAIDSIEYTYPICDILDYYEDYTENNPNHSLFYNETDGNEKHNINKSSKIIEKDKKKIKPIYYIEDINIPELDDIMKDSQLQFKVSNLEHKLEGIFVGYFEMVNNYILNAIDTDSKGNYFVKPQAIQQKDITNLTKLINMFEYNKLPYNKHALSVVLEKKNKYTDYLYGLNNTIDTTLVKYNDANTSNLNTSALNNFALSNHDTNDALDSFTSYIDKVTIADKVKIKLLEDIEETTKTNNKDSKDNNYENEALEDEKEILSKLTKGLSAHIKYLDTNSLKANKIPITVKDFLSLASTIKANLGINEFTINNMNEYKVGFIVRKNNRVLYDHDEKVNHNKNVFVHDILTKELKKLNIPFKTTSFDNASFEDQAEFLKDVKILIACHGAAFTNLFLLPKNATIMEVSFRKYWYCDPVCQCHVSAQCPYKKDCHTVSDSHHYDKKTKKLDYFKGDYYNLSQLFGIGYKEILIEDASDYFKNPGDKDYNPINLTNLYIDTNAMIDKIKKLY